MPDGTAVPEGMVRCVLHGSDVVLLTLTANNGEQNLWNHMETAHAITRFTGDMEKEKKGRKRDQKKTEVGAQGAIEEAFRAQTGLTKVALTRAVFKFIINEPLPFDLVASTSCLTRF
jgi:hypothetical protein